MKILENSENYLKLKRDRKVYIRGMLAYTSGAAIGLVWSVVTNKQTFISVIFALLLLGFLYSSFIFETMLISINKNAQKIILSFSRYAPIKVTPKIEKSYNEIRQIELTTNQRFYDLNLVLKNGSPLLMDFCDKSIHYKIWSGNKLPLGELADNGQLVADTLKVPFYNNVKV